jgi:hypothetical protein
MASPAMRSRSPRPHFALEITIVLLVKFVALWVIWALWFSHA